MNELNPNPTDRSIQALLGSEVKLNENPVIRSSFGIFMKILGLLSLVLGGLLVFFHVSYDLVSIETLHSLEFEASYREFVDKLSKEVMATSFMNIIELALWVLFPSLLFLVGLRLIIGHLSGRTTAILGTLVFISVFALLQLTSYFGAKNWEKRLLPEVEEVINRLYYPNVTTYRFDSLDVEYAVTGYKISFQTSDSYQMLSSYYVSKGFSDSNYPYEGEHKLMKDGKDIYIDERKSNGTTVSQSVRFSERAE